MMILKIIPHLDMEIIPPAWKNGDLNTMVLHEKGI